MAISEFDLVQERGLQENFLRDGYVIIPVENRAGLGEIRNLIASIAAERIGKPMPEDPATLLNEIHTFVELKDLNALRLAVINGLRATPWFRPTYFSLARSAIYSLVGNELAMQRGVGLSVQLPNDTSSLLQIHADVWDGDSAYELVAWLPLVNCYKTKSMYIASHSVDRDFQQKMHEFQRGTPEDLFQAVKEHVTFLDVPYGSILLFSQTLMHGNRINLEPETRWSMNCRFKSLLSPFADKSLGEFFEPITVRPVTKMGVEYKLPGGFLE